MVTAAHGIANPLEMVGTVLEVADIALLAYEHRKRGPTAANQGREGDRSGTDEDVDDDKEMSKLRSENRRLRALLEENLSLLQDIEGKPFAAVARECPSDLHERLMTAVESANYLTQLETFQKESAVSTDYYFPFNEGKGINLKSFDVMLHDDHGESSWWVWISEEIDHNKLEELSGIDCENYVIVCEDHVVDGIANFVAKCILANPRSKMLAPEEVQKIVSKALGCMKDQHFLKNIWFAGKLIYSLSTWGIALAGLYTNRTIVKAAAKGVIASGKLAMKAL